LADLATPKTKDRSVHLDTDFEAFKRALEQDRERVAAEHAAEVFGGAPATEPAPGSPDYQAADADARRIVAEQGARDAAAPSSSANKASVAVPAAGAGGAGSAVGEVLKDVGVAAVRALPTIVRGASAPALAGAILLTPGNTGSRLQEIGDGLRVRINPDERAVRIERRVDNGLFGTGIGAKWQELPVNAEQVDTPDGRRIAIDGAGLERAIGEGAFAGLSSIDGIQMAKPPSDGDKPDERRPVGPGHNNPPEPTEPEPPPNPGPLTAPIIKRSESAQPSDKGNAGPPLSDEERKAIHEAARAIAAHAFQEHVIEKAEFPGVRSYQDFVAHIENAMLNATDSFTVEEDGRTFYWHGPSQTLVIRAPQEPHGGSAFKPDDGRSYYDRRKSYYEKQNRR
jgi:filamentous hemagglutinin